MALKAHTVRAPRFTAYMISLFIIESVLCKMHVRLVHGTIQEELRTS